MPVEHFRAITLNVLVEVNRTCALLRLFLA